MDSWHRSKEGGGLARQPLPGLPRFNSSDLLCCQIISVENTLGGKTCIDHPVWAQSHRGQSLTRIRCPVSSSRMRYSPGDDRASIWTRAFATTKLLTAPRQSTPPSGSILKMSSEGSMAFNHFREGTLIPMLRHPILSLLGQFISHCGNPQQQGSRALMQKGLLDRMTLSAGRPLP